MEKSLANIYLFVALVEQIPLLDEEPPPKYDTLEAQGLVDMG